MLHREPVFVVGSPRSGTTLLYHILLSSGLFPVYRTETHTFTTVAHRFNLHRARDRRKLLDVWLRSKLLQLSGLDADVLRARVMYDCRNCGDFLCTVMEGIAEKQHTERWAEKTPEHLLYAPEIKKTIPDALFLHIIRDGRDVACSMGRLGFCPPFPWDRGHETLVAGLYWEWLLRHGRHIAQSVGRDYIEVRYEKLVTKPQETLDRIGAFIGCELDYRHILRCGIGSLVTPNTAFPDSDGPFIGRWKQALPRSEALRLEEMIAPTLRDLGYETELLDPACGPSLAARRMRASYHTLFYAKWWLKHRAPFNRLVRLSPLRPAEFDSHSSSARARAVHSLMLGNYGADERT